MLTNIDQGEASALLERSPTTMTHIGQEAALNFWQSNAPHCAPFHCLPTQSSTDSFTAGDTTMTFPWYAEGSTDAELLDATGAIMLQMDSNSAESYFQPGSWMPG